jgi:hypothetical protein
MRPAQQPWRVSSEAPSPRTTTVQDSTNTAISKIYADSLESPAWPWTTIYGKIKIVADNLNDGLGFNGRGPQTPSSSRNSSATTGPSDDTSKASLIRQIKELQNAQRAQR